MINIISKKNWWFLISLLVIVPGLISLVVWGVRLSIDFTGGSTFTFTFPATVTQQTIQSVGTVFRQQKLVPVSEQASGNSLTVQTSPVDDKQNEILIIQLQRLTKAKEESFETIGPTIGQETTVNAVKALVIAAILIVFYIALSFRKVPKPASSWRFGVCAIIALIHDVLVVVGIFSILGHFFGIEVDSLFVTALLTVIGFSVHDTIVVFDRIRENLRRTIGLPFGQVVNDSILQTLVRSLNTSLTALLVLFTLLLFGGASIRWFIVALLIGITSGTYSSIFNAAQLLVLWQEWRDKRKQR